jgi:peptidoglycan/LPS O-acetylase OafA/YrhL
MRDEHKYESLDGLRGLAALSVVLLHYVQGFAPFLVGYVATRRHVPFERAISTTPLQLPLAGNFAVCIFFVLSGFVLSLSFFRHKDAAVLIPSAARRYFRLLLPALGSVMLAYFVLRVGGIHAKQASVGSESSTWLAILWNSPAHLSQALYQGFYGIWFGAFNVSDSYNVVLWTMHYELLGSFLVFMFLALFGKMQNRWLIYAAFGLIFIKTYYLGFVFGMAISDIFVTQPAVKNKLSNRLLWFLLPVAIVLGTWTNGTIYQSVYSRIHVAALSPAELEIFMHTLGALIIVLAAIKLDALSRLLKTRMLQYLGKISFALYLTHLVILGSLASYLFTVILPHAGYVAATTVAFTVSVSISLIVATFYTRWVDMPSINISRQLGNYLVSGDMLGDARKAFGKLRIPRTARLARTLPPEGAPIED